MDTLKVLKNASCSYVLMGVSGLAVGKLILGTTLKSVIMIPVGTTSLSLANVAAAPFLTAYLVYKLLPRYFSDDTRAKIGIVSGVGMFYGVCTFTGMTFATGLILNVGGLAGACLMVFVCKKGYQGCSKIYTVIRNH